MNETVQQGLVSRFKAPNIIVASQHGAKTFHTFVTIKLGSVSQLLKHSSTIYISKTIFGALMPSGVCHEKGI